MYLLIIFTNTYLRLHTALHNNYETKGILRRNQLRGKIFHLFTATGCQT